MYEPNHLRRSRRRVLASALVSGIVAVAILAARVRSATPALPDAPPLAEIPDAFVPGLSLSFESTKDKQTDARVARLVALNVPAGSAPTPFLQPGPFRARFEGFIEQKIRSDYEFSAAGNGVVTLTINDKEIFSAKADFAAAESKKATLKKGKNKFLVTYESPESGDAMLRLFWNSDEFPAEPPDPRLYTHSAANKALATSLRIREGRNLFADLHCAHCHTDAALISGPDSMPEMAQDAPNLDDVGSRLRGAWMARWISNPKALRPDTSMPNLFHGKPGATAQEGADIAAYLTTLGPPVRDGEAAPAAESITAGGRVITRLGCIGCHTLADKAVGADAARVPWHFVKAKFKSTGLVEFLKQPEKHYAWIRMPNFRLTEQEAKDAAAYLLSTSADLDGDTPAGDAARGKLLVQSSGCVNCHALKTDNSYKAPALATLGKDAWSRGCVARDDAARGKAPDFALSEDQRIALIAFAATDRSSLKRDTLSEFAERQITALRCVACHTRDTKQDIWDDLVKETEGLSKGDQADPESGGGGAAAPGPNAAKGLPGEPAPGTGDQTRPLLTWTGEKLRPEWMATFIAGKLDYKPRAWMRARMPGFPARGEGIAHGLALEHGFPVASPADAAAAKPDDEMAKIGKQLVGRNGGFSCIQCHGIANIAPISPFEAPSINFKYVSERIRREYYDRWMRNPTRLWPTTKMPAFADTEGKSSLRDILEGDAVKQFDAIWNYLEAGRKIRHPEEEAANP